jgi:hypothetical protein
MKPHRPNIAPLVLALALALGVFPKIQAAEGEREISGEITAKAADSISILVGKTKKTETFVITLETAYLRGRDRISDTDVKIGELALIHARKDNGREIAVTVTTKPSR